MWTFIFSGTLYLIGVGAILLYKPSFMFAPDGNWKEFGIGKSEERYTPFPFWLFCIVWALISYIFVLSIMGFSGYLSKRKSITFDDEVMPQYNNGRRNRNMNMANLNKRNISEPVELPKGYYILNEKATQLSGVPKYVYLGPEEPSM
jgi:hypothetical protein